jgi:tRNA pseudouridine55 synthase
VRHVRKALGTKTVGHTGTLDPFATGLLVILVGRATRLARFVESASKTYLATARLGLRTETDDRTGAPVGEPADVSGLDRARVEAALRALVGSHMQRPPAYSAKRVAGVRSYRLARRGQAVALAEVPVTVHRIELVGWHQGEVTFRTVVSAGTYVRALARDLGEALGVGAHLTALRREAIGSLRVADAIPPDRVTADTPLLSLRRVLADLPAVELDESALESVRHGRAVPERPGTKAARRRAGEPILLLADGDVVAVARSEDGWLKPSVVLEPA